MSGWSRGLLHESANPPGAKRASCPGYMEGTLWADSALPGDSTGHRQEGAGQKRQQGAQIRADRHKNQHPEQTHLHHRRPTRTRIYTHTHTRAHDDDRERQAGNAVRNVQALPLHRHIPTRAEQISTRGCAHTEVCKRFWAVSLCGEPQEYNQSD